MVTFMEFEWFGKSIGAFDSIVENSCGFISFMFHKGSNICSLLWFESIEARVRRKHCFKSEFYLHVWPLKPSSDPWWKFLHHLALTISDPVVCICLYKPAIRQNTSSFTNQSCSWQWMWLACQIGSESWEISGTGDHTHHHHHFIPHSISFLIPWNGMWHAC